MPRQSLVSPPAAKQPEPTSPAPEPTPLAREGNPTLRAKPSPMRVLLALIMALSCGCGQTNPSPPITQTTSPTATPATAPPLEQARAAASRGDWRTAAGHARTALQQNPAAAEEARAILLETSLRIGDYRGARELLASVPEPSRKALAARQLEHARQSLGAQDYPDAILRARLVQSVDPAAHEVLARAYLATNQTELAVRELRNVPGSEAQIRLLEDELSDRSRTRTLELARRQLALARRQAAADQWGQAAVSAHKAAAMLSRLGGHPEEQAEAVELQAREAATRGELGQASRLMREALALHATQAYRQKLAEYEEDDRQLVSRAELVDVDSFTFPPTAAGNTPSSLLYLLGSSPDDPILGSRELAYTPKTSQFSAQGGALVTLRIEGPGRDYWNLVFAAPRRQRLAPGLYQRAGSDDPEAASVDVSGCGRGASQSRGKFRVYEVEYRGDDLVRFAADFVVSAEGHEPFFGKVRFHSTYR